MRKSYCFILISLLLGITILNAQTTTKKVLFLGNSYTAYNNLPAIVSTIASANGDSIIYEAISPGGQYLQAHANDQQVLTAFQQGNWDYIVAQEQSQIPVIPHFRESLMYPGAAQLESLRDLHSPGATLIYFMTWGRQNGGQQCNSGYCSHAFTDFYDFQDTLTWAYQQTAIQTNCGIAPVGEMWRELMLQYQPSMPTLMLFSTDGSHPSEQGSYVAALTIYSTIFNKLVSSIPHIYAGVDPLLDTFFKQITDANLWPRYLEWNLQPLFSYEQEIKSLSRPFVYPNPASDRVRINSNTPFLYVEICDVFGRSLIKSNEDSVSLSTLAKGFYIAIIHYENARYSAPFIVE